MRKIIPIILIFYCSCQESKPSENNEEPPARAAFDMAAKIAVEKGLITDEDKTTTYVLDYRYTNSNPDTALLILNKFIKEAEEGKAPYWFVAPKDSFTITQERIAFDKALFGMSPKEYEKISESVKLTIEGSSYLLHPVYDKENRLYLMGVESIPKTANYYDTEVMGDIINLKEAISDKYGAPQSSAGVAGLASLEPGYIQWAYTWSVGNKRIKIGVEESHGGYKYSAVCWIYDKKLYALKERDKEVSERKKNLEASSKF